LQQPTADRVEEELAEVGVLATVRDFLPADWKTRFADG